MIVSLGDIPKRIETIVEARDSVTSDQTQTIGSLVLAENVAQTEFLRIVAELMLYVAQSRGK